MQVKKINHRDSVKKTGHTKNGSTPLFHHTTAPVNWILFLEPWTNTTISIDQYYISRAPLSPYISSYHSKKGRTLHLGRNRKVDWPLHPKILLACQSAHKEQGIFPYFFASPVPGWCKGEPKDQVPWQISGVDMALNSLNSLFQSFYLLPLFQPNISGSELCSNFSFKKQDQILFVPKVVFFCISLEI